MTASKSVEAGQTSMLRDQLAKNADAHDAWKRHNGDKPAAARVLGITVKELSARIVAHLDSVKPTETPAPAPVAEVEQDAPAETPAEGESKRTLHANCPRCGYTYPKPRARQMCQSDNACAARQSNPAKQASRRVAVAAAAE
jgi:hypothetical protein